VENVILTIGLLHGNAHRISKKDKCQYRTKRKVRTGAQSALCSMEKKPHLNSKSGQRYPHRGRQPKRYFSITAGGKKALQKTRDLRNKLWYAIPEVALEFKFTG
jgi:PadR family transcriptional regulator PadR